MKVFEEYIIPINETAKDYDEMFVEIIRRQPVLIRCKDCKYCETMTIFGKTTLYSCTRKNPAVDVLPSDYCSRGRRNESG